MPYGEALCVRGLSKQTVLHLQFEWYVFTAAGDSRGNEYSCAWGCHPSPTASSVTVHSVILALSYSVIFRYVSSLNENAGIIFPLNLPSLHNMSTLWRCYSVAPFLHVFCVDLSSKSRSCEYSQEKESLHRTLQPCENQSTPCDQ